MNEEQEAKEKRIAREIDFFFVWVLIYPASFFFFYQVVRIAHSGFLGGVPTVILIGPFACFGSWLSGRLYYRAMKNAEGDSRQRTVTAIVWFLVRPVSFLIMFFGWEFYCFFFGGYSSWPEQARFMLILAILFSFGAWCHGYLFFKLMDSLKKN